METKRKLSDDFLFVNTDTNELALTHRQVLITAVIDAVRVLEDRLEQSEAAAKLQLARNLKLEDELQTLRISHDTLQSSYDDAQAVLSNVLAHRDALEQRRGELLGALQKNKEGYRLMTKQRDAALDKLEQIRDLLD